MLVVSACHLLYRANLEMVQSVVKFVRSSYKMAQHPPSKRQRRDDVPTKLLLETSSAVFMTGKQAVLSKPRENASRHCVPFGV